MRIGIDCRTILHPETGERAGIGHYTHYLVSELLAQPRKHHYVLFFDARIRDLTPYERPNVTLKRFPFSTYRRFLPFAYSHMLVSATLLKERLHLYHNPANIVPLTYRRPSVITIHDLAIYKNPSWFPGQVFSRHLLVPQSVKHAKAIIAVSESTKADLRELFNVPARKVTVVHEGVDVKLLPLQDRHVDVRVKFHLPKRFFLFVGTLEARKNLVRLVQAFGRYLETEGKEDRDLVLVLAGNPGWKADEVEDEIRELKLDRRVRRIGYVTHNEKIALMRGALAFVFPSVYEGFGLSVLEAMALGTPVMTSNVSSLPEVAGHAALFVDPQEVSDLRDGFARLASEGQLRDHLSDAGRKQAAKFSWRRSAEETLAVYERVANTHRGKARKR